MQVHFDGALDADRSGRQACQETTSRLFYRATRTLGEPPEPACARLASVEIGGVEIVEVTSPPGSSLRDTHALHRDGVDAMFVSVMASGMARLELDHRSIVQRAGDIVMWDAGRSHRWVHENATTSRCVRIPRPLMNAVPMNNLTARVVSGATPMGALAGSLLGDVSRLPPTNRCVAHRLRASLVDLLVAALTPDREEASPGAAVRRRLDAAKDYMLARLDDAALDAARLAKAIGASERSLARAFATEGTTPARWLWQQRLARAHRLLSAAAVRSVMEASLACGFASASHFSRAFRHAYRCSPNDVLPRPARER